MKSMMFHVFLALALVYAVHAMPGKPRCARRWAWGKEYCAGAKVSRMGEQYVSVWCTQARPGTGARYDGWKTLGPCSTKPHPKSPKRPKRPSPRKPKRPSRPAPRTKPPSTTRRARTSSPRTRRTSPPAETRRKSPTPGSSLVVAYFASWKVYHNYYIKNVVTSGSAAKLTHIVYAFGGVRADGTCYLVDPEADTEKYFTSQNSVDGTSDRWDQPLRGNFNQIRQLKKRYPHIKVLFSFGGWTLSSNFGAVSKNPEPFARSCHDLVFNERWKGVFDGIDIDWEYPNACGATCDNSGRKAYSDVLGALRKRFGNALVTSAITADGTEGGKIDATDYFSGSKHLDFMMVMTYDYFGAWTPTGPTAPHSPTKPYPGIPNKDFHAVKSINKLKASGIPSKKLLLGIGFYGRGWTGVSQKAPGGRASGPAKGIEPGIESYKVLKRKCAPTGVVGGTSYAYCSPDWWSYDTPNTVRGKRRFADGEGLGGLFAWELSGDTVNGELLAAMATG